MSDQKLLMTFLSDSLEKLQNLHPEAKQHYLAMMLMLTESFIKDSGASCVMLYRNNERFSIASANANEEDTVEMIQEGLEGVFERATAGAPPKEMFN